jgi:hypothetical protein
MSEDERRSLRMPPRGLVARTGKMLLGSGAPPIECHVVNLSAGGACLKLPQLMNVPKNFEFLHGGTRHVCRLVWQRALLIGVSYEGSKPKSLHASALSSTPKHSFLSRRPS